MPQNNYNEIMEAFTDYVKNISIEKYLKNMGEIEQFCETLENDLGFHPVERLKEEIKIINEHKSN